MFNSQSFDKCADECLVQISKGVTIEECLNKYPEHADQLMPFLQTATAISRPRMAPSPEADERIKSAMLAAYKENDQIERSPVSFSASARYTGWKQQNEKYRRHDRMNNRMIFPQIFPRAMGVVAAIALVTTVGLYAYTIFSPSSITETTIGTIDSIATEPAVKIPVEPTQEPLLNVSPIPINDSGRQFIFESPDQKFQAVIEPADGYRSATLTIKNESEIVTEAVNDADDFETEFDLVGWAANGEWVYYMYVSGSDECQSPAASSHVLNRHGLYNGGAHANVGLGHIVDIAMSPDNTKLAYITTDWQGDSLDYAPLTVVIVDANSAELISSIPITTDQAAAVLVPEEASNFGPRAIGNKIYWSEDSTQLVAELNQSPCPEPKLGEVQVYQLIEAEAIGGSSRLFSSKVVELDESSRMHVEAFTSERLTIVDEANACDYSIDISTQGVTSETCADRIKNFE